MASTHHDYGKKVLAAATDGTAKQYGRALKIDYGTGWQARIGGVVGDDIAVEFEHRDDRQVRGTVMDLICHPHPKKVLILIPANIRDIKATATQCETIFGHFFPPRSFQVIVLAGTGSRPMLKQDAATLATALGEMAGRRVGRTRTPGGQSTQTA